MKNQTNTTILNNLLNPHTRHNHLIINTMGDIVMFFFLQNIIIFSGIFWALTILGSYFYKKKNHKSKRSFYECGFKSIADINLQINLNFIMICVFLILYDIEFTFLFPALFNIWSLSAPQLLYFTVFVIFIIISLYYDIITNALSWSY